MKALKIKGEKALLQVQNVLIRSRLIHHHKIISDKIIQDHNRAESIRKRVEKSENHVRRRSDHQ